MGDETLILDFRFQERNQNTPIPCNCLTMPAREMSPEFFRPLNNPLKVADVYTWKCYWFILTEGKDSELFLNFLNCMIKFRKSFKEKLFCGNKIFTAVL
jgi:hypothetical protein